MQRRTRILMPCYCAIPTNKHSLALPGVQSQCFLVFFAKGTDCTHPLRTLYKTFSWFLAMESLNSFDVTFLAGQCCSDNGIKGSVEDPNLAPNRPENNGKSFESPTNDEANSPSLNNGLSPADLAMHVSWIAPEGLGQCQEGSTIANLHLE